MKPRLGFWQIVNMNLGFFGIQYSFGLQKSNMSPIYKFLGAEETSLPYLWLAGPITGLIIPPVIGVWSDQTRSRWGRRRPFFLAGALLAAMTLLAMPFSSALWMAASLLCILGVANNVTMEPYRAFVSDKLDASQHSTGYLAQSAFTGLGQTLSYLTPTLLVLLGMNRDSVNEYHIPHVIVAAFLTGAAFSIGSIWWTLHTTDELPLTTDEEADMRRRRSGAFHALGEILGAMREMPATMRQLAVVKFLQWYALYCYWQYIALSLAKTLFGTADATSPGFREAGLINGQIGSFYNLIAFAGAFLIVPCTRRYGPQRVHCCCLVLAGTGLFVLPLVQTKLLLFVPMIGLGLAWASIMGTPYVMLAGSIPAHRAGVFMGIFNIFVVIPMIVQILTLPLIYRTWLAGDPQNVIRLSGVLFIAAAIAVLFVKTKAPYPVNAA